MNFRLMGAPLPSFDGAPVQIIAGVMIHDKVIAEGRSSSIKYAKLKASVEALKLLDGLPSFKFREQCGCDCRQAVEDVDRNGRTGTAV